MSANLLRRLRNDVGAARLPLLTCLPYPAAPSPTRPPAAKSTLATGCRAYAGRMQARTQPRTLMAVHAHPDDEASSTGGILARYASEGVRTVLVTCTNGELGDGEGGSKPGAAGHDTAAVVRQRRRELERSCEILQVSDLEMLGYHDSGMM